MWTFDDNGPEIQQLYSRMRDQEIQGVAGRWRALSRRHLYDLTVEGTDWATMANSTIRGAFENILLIAKCQLDRSQTAEKLNKFRDRIDTIVTAALHLNRVLGEQVTSSDLEIIRYTNGVEFDPTVMEDAEGTDENIQPSEIEGTVLCTTELGLRRVIKVAKADANEFQSQILLKPKVALLAHILVRDC